MTKKLVSLLVAICLVSVFGCSQKKSKDKPKPPDKNGTKVNDSKPDQPKLSNALAEIDGIPISKDEFILYLDPYPARMKESIQGREHVLQSLIEHILLRAEAKRLKLDKDSDYRRKVENYRRNLLNNLLLDKVSKGSFEVTDAETKEYFDSHPDEFDRPERVQVRHILLAGQSEAKQALKRINSGEPFEQLAKELSKDNSTKSRGGDLGAFTRKQRPELAEAAFKLTKPGQLSPPIQTSRGFHLLKMIRRLAPVKETFAQAREGLISRMRARKRQEVKKDLLGKLRAKAKIDVNRQALETLALPKE